MAAKRGGRGARKKGNGDTTANLGFEDKLWKAADALRANMDAAEYKHVVLGLIFLKYISDAFEAKHADLAAQKKKGADPEDPDEYRASSIFWVPKEARWPHLKASAPQPTIGKAVDDAMAAVEHDNPSLKGVLPKDYARPGLDKQRLGQLINLVSDIGLGSPADRAKDILGRVYEYFLSQFASAEGKKGGQFYTPSRVVRVLVEVLAPYKGRVYDPCCGSGGMFVSSEKFIEAHSGRIGDISIYGQESNYTTWRLAKMNLAIRGIDAQIAHGDTFHNDRHPDLKADYVLANPPFFWRLGRRQPQREVGARGAQEVAGREMASRLGARHIAHHVATRATRVVLFLVVGLACFVALEVMFGDEPSGAGARDGAPWADRFPTQAFTGRFLVATNTSADPAILAAEAEKAFASTVEWLNIAEPRTTLQLPVIICATTDDIAWLELRIRTPHANDPRREHWDIAGGYYPSVPLIAFVDTPGRTTRTIHHEVAHYVTSLIAPARPDVINEGIAMCIEGALLNEADASAWLRQRGRVCRSALRMNALPGVKEMFGLSYFEFREPRDGRYYTLSWCLVNSIVSMPDAVPLREYLARLASEQDPWESFQDLYSVGRVESAWREEVGRVAAVPNEDAHGAPR